MFPNLLHRSFQQTLDGCLTSINLQPEDKRSWHCVKQLLRRLQHVHSLRAVALAAHSFSVDSLNSLLGCLPNHITSLQIVGYNLNLKALGNLPNLTYLHVSTVIGRITGLKYVSGLTRLHFSAQVPVQVAHLAPTLKHLGVSSFVNVEGLAHLTNLEVLEAFGWLPGTLFETYGQLRLKHLRILPKYSYDNSYKFHNDPQVWKAAPTTLTRLTLNNVQKLLPGVLPITITHLQLLNVYENNVGEQVAAALPWLRRLDVSTNSYSQTIHSWSSACIHLSRLHSLESLGLCVKTKTLRDDVYKFSTRAQLLSAIPGIATALERRVKLDVMETEQEMFEVFGHPCDIRLRWADPS